MEAASGDGDARSDDVPVDVNEEEQAWDEAMHQALNLAKAQGKEPGGITDTIRAAHDSVLDWRALLRRYMTDTTRCDYSWSLPNRRFIDSGLYLPSIRSEGIDIIAVIIDTSASLPARTLAAFWSEVREIATELQPETVVVLQGRRRLAGRGRVCRKRLARGDRAQGPRRHGFPAGLRVAGATGHTARRLPLSHRHGVRQLPRRRA